MSPKNIKGTNNLPRKKKLFNCDLQSASKKGRSITKNSKFSVILNKKLRVFRVSPMYNFSSNRLRFYESKLNEYININKKASSKFVVYRSKMTLNEDLRLRDHCAEALQVEIIKNDLQSTYVGHFLSFNNTKPDVEGSISLPLLLVEVKGHEINEVHSSLCKIFDCDIQPVTFSLYALITFFVKLLETPRNNIDVSQEQLTLEYRVPECEIKDKIIMSLFLETTTIIFAVIMDSLQEKYERITTMEIVLEFYNKILNHGYHIFKMDLSLAELQKVTFPDAFLTNDGQLKMSSDEAAISALEVLEHFTPLDSIMNI